MKNNAKKTKKLLPLAVLLAAAALLGILVYHEAVTPYKLLGMAAILGAVVLLNRPERSR